MHRSAVSLKFTGPCVSVRADGTSHSLVKEHYREHNKSHPTEIHSDAEYSDLKTSRFSIHRDFGRDLQLTPH